MPAPEFHNEWGRPLHDFPVTGRQPLFTVELIATELDDEGKPCVSLRPSLAEVRGVGGGSCVVVEAARAARSSLRTDGRCWLACVWWWWVAEREIGSF